MRVAKSFLPGLLAILLALSGCATSPSVMDEPIPGNRAGYAPKKQNVIQPSYDLPRVMLLMDERSMGSVPASEVTILVTQKLIDNNYPVANQDMVQSKIQREQAMLQLAGDPRGAAALGLEFGADVVILGEAVAKPSARRIGNSNMRAYQATVTMQAIRTDNADAMATATGRGKVLDVDDTEGNSKALVAAGGACMDELLPRLSTAWGGGRDVAAPAAKRVEISVGGVDQMWKLKGVREELQGLTGEITHVKQRSYKAGVATFEVHASVGETELSEAILTNPPARLKYQVLSVAPGHIQLKAVPSR